MATQPGPLTRQVQDLIGQMRLAEAERLLMGAEVGSDLLHARGLLSLARLDPNHAITLFAAARTAQPDSGWLACDHGRALLASGRLTEAVSTLRHAVQLEPGHLQAWLSLGLAHERLGDNAPARDAYQQAAQLDPRQPAAPYNLGNLAYAQGDAAAARRHYAEALKRYPGFAAAWAALGSLEFDQCDWPAAEKALHRAIEVDPGWSTPRETLAHLMLAQQRWNEGWQAYAWRAARVGVDVHLPRPADVIAMPAPVQLKGLKVLVAGEQGLGDVLFFLRWWPMLRLTTAALGFWGDERLFPLLRELEPDLYLSSKQQTLPAGWVAVRSGDLPLLLDPAGKELPPPLHLHIKDEALGGEINNQLQALGPPPYIGLTWRAGTAANRQALAKCIPPALFGAALTTVKGTLISLQRNPESAEMAELQAAAGRNIADLSAWNTDLQRMAVLMSLLDHYVAVSNTNVHLRAGAGKPSIVLVPRPPEWRWVKDGEASPWYPGSVVLRQEAGGWSRALSRLQSLIN